MSVECIESIAASGRSADYCLPRALCAFRVFVRVSYYQRPAFKRSRLKSLFLSLLFISGTAGADWNTGSSHNLFYRTKLDTHWYFVGRGNLATRNGFDDLFFAYLDAGIGYSLNKNWSLESSYRHASLQRSSGWREEYRLHFNAAYRRKFGEWGFRNRHRVELRFFEGDSNDHIRYRNESVLTAPFKVTQFRLSPYIAEEFFYEFTNNHLNVNWLTAGLTYAISKNQKFKIGYRWQTQKFSGTWTNRYVLVLGYSVFNF